MSETFKRKNSGAQNRKNKKKKLKLKTRSWQTLLKNGFQYLQRCLLVHH